jgi:hypothetical protein
MMKTTFEKQDTGVFSVRVEQVKLAAQAMIAEHFVRNGFHTEPPKIEHSVGLRYIRLIRAGPSERSAYCFIDIATGDILKAASWMTPAKRPRSNIWDSDFGVSGLTPYGARYL